MPTRSVRYACATALLLVQTAACARAAPTGTRPGAVSPEESPALFSAAVGWFAGRTEFPVRVDPRPLRPEVRLTSVTDAHLLPGADATVRMRRAVVEAAGWGVADAVADWRCVFAEGYPRAGPPASAATDTLQARRAACRRNGRYESLVLSLPQAAADPAHPGRWRIRAMRMLLHGYEGVELYLEQDASGAWQVVDAQVLTGAFS